MTATLDMAGRLSQEACVSRDGMARSLSPAERLGELKPSPAHPLGVLRQSSGGAAKRIGVPARHQLAGPIHTLRQAGVAERDHWAAAGHGLEAGQAETL